MRCSYVEENAWLIAEVRLGRLVEDHRKETGSWITSGYVCTSYFEAVYSPVTLLGVQPLQVVPNKVACEYLTYNITMRKLNV